MDRQRHIVFMGKVGHGKTRLMNQLTNSCFASSAAASSCTRQIQLAKITESNMYIIDTPGFYSSEDVTEHINAQFDAFRRPISGVYAVIRLGAPSEMAEVANRMMDFTGEEDIRVICTYLDTVENEVGFDGDKVATELSDLLDIPKRNVALIGMTTDIFAIREFIFGSTHEPRMIKVSKDQRAVATSLSVGNRKFNKEIDDLSLELDSKLKAVNQYDQELSPCYIKAFVKRVMTDKAEESFKEACRSIESRASELNPSDENKVTRLLETVKKKTMQEFRCHRNSNDRPYSNNHSRKRHFHGRYDNTGSPQYNNKRNKLHWNKATKDLESDLYEFLSARLATNFDTTQLSSKQEKDSLAIPCMSAGHYATSTVPETNFSGKSKDTLNVEAQYMDSPPLSRSSAGTYRTSTETETSLYGGSNDVSYEPNSSWWSIQNPSQTSWSSDTSSYKQKQIDYSQTRSTHRLNTDNQGISVGRNATDDFATTTLAYAKRSEKGLGGERRSSSRPHEDLRTSVTENFHGLSSLQSKGNTKIEPNETQPSSTKIQPSSTEISPDHLNNTREQSYGSYRSNNEQITPSDSLWQTIWTGWDGWLGVRDVEMEFHG